MTKHIEANQLWSTPERYQAAESAAYELRQLAEQFDVLMGAYGLPVSPGHALDFICQIEEQLAVIRAAASNSP